MKRTAWHLVHRPSDGWPLLTTPESGLTFARVVSSYASEFQVLTFNAVRSHSHQILFGTPDEVGRYSRKTKLSLFRSLDLQRPFQPIPARPIESASHLLRSIHYTFRQAEHHGLEADPLHAPSNLGDLIGYRILAPETRRLLLSVLPGFDPRDLLPHLGNLELVPGRELGHLHDAAAAVVGLPALKGRGAVITLARVAATHVAQRLGASTRQVAGILEVSTRAVNYFSRQDPDAGAVRAIQFQIGLREQIGRRVLRANGTIHSSHGEIRSR